jgi:hypothetical protein
MSRNIEESIELAGGGLMIVVKEIDEIGRMGRSKKRNEDGVKSREVEDGIGKVGRVRGR